VGCNGQDGRYLVAQLKAKGYSVTGIDRPGSASLTPKRACNIQKEDEVITLLHDLAPDEIYYLAAFHHASEIIPRDDHTLIRRSFEINALALSNCLYAITAASPRARLFYASSSRIFGEPLNEPQDEKTPVSPLDPYGISKAAGVNLCRYYRQRRGIYASVGILYNHESPFRAASYITRKVVQAAVRIRKQAQTKLVVGDLDAMVDWGYAPDYVDAMWRILQLPEPDDFVIATGTLHSVRELISMTFSAVGLNWTEHVEVDSRLARNQSYNNLRGNSAKLESKTGWRPTLSLADIVREMITAEEQDGR
jgi:GDPmannose 4,6-dehydratase